MLIISDTNILSSLAAGDALPLLFQLFPKSPMYIPLAVQEELQIGLDRGENHLSQVWQAIAIGKIKILKLSIKEQNLLHVLPDALNLGECEAIILAQNRHGRLLSNDKKAVNYCQANKIKTATLIDLLRDFWLRKIASPTEVKELIQRMEKVERLKLKPNQLTLIFAPRRKKR